jgi:hypothetical protein
MENDGDWGSLGCNWGARVYEGGCGRWENALKIIGLGKAKVFENDLDVLLRHRPLSIRRRSGGARLVGASGRSRSNVHRARVARGGTD